jgi:hypothetical protein
MQILQRAELKQKFGLGGDCVVDSVLACCCVCCDVYVCPFTPVIAIYENIRLTGPQDPNGQGGRVPARRRRCDPDTASCQRRDDGPCLNVSTNPNRFSTIYPIYGEAGGDVLVQEVYSGVK